MKKIAVTSVLAIIAANGANAANVIDGNPLYRPTLKHYVSETTLTTGENSYANPRLAYGYDLTENFMYGFTDRFVSIRENSHVWFCCCLLFRASGFQFCTSACRKIPQLNLQFNMNLNR